jgi:hypothetical protein
VNQGEDLMKKYFSAIIIPALLIGCGLPKNLRTPDKADSSVIGISVKTLTLKVFKNRQDTVYFVKLDEKDDNLLVTKLIPSNYTRGDYAYLINAEPGKYAAVASFFQQTDNSYNSFYDLNTIKNNVITVGPKQIAFMGAITVENHYKNIYNNIEKNGDKAQLHYYNLLKTFIYGTHYCGTLDKADRSSQVEKDFLLKTKDYFKDSGWLPFIDERLELLNKAL